MQDMETTAIISYIHCYKLLKFNIMSTFKHEFIFKLNIKNLLFLHEQIEMALKDKDPNDLIRYLKILEQQKENAKTTDDYDSLCKSYSLLDSALNFNCL